MRTAVWTAAATMALACVSATPATAQPSERTATAAKTFVDIMTPKAEGYAPRYMAAADPNDDERFLAAMLIPGVQLLIVDAKYEVPVLLRERLLTGKYQEAYLDLSTATAVEDRLTIEDILADGLAFKPAKGVAAGDVVIRGGETVKFDGQWRKQKIKEDAYKEAFAAAEDDYLRILALLVEQAR